jgi:CheY-like chemotaxis protein
MIGAPTPFTPQISSLGEGPMNEPTARRRRRQVRVIHWNADEARERAARLAGDRYEVEAGPIDPGSLRALKTSPPDALVIDLSRLPSHGRDVALGCRSSRALRRVPIVFVEGDAEKVARIRTLLPDAVYSTWKSIRRDLRRALASAPSDPVVPASVLAGYSGTPLPKKLGIKAGATVALVDAPRGFVSMLGALPDGVTFGKALAGEFHLVVCFVRSREALLARLGQIAPVAPRDGAWIAWPKQASGVVTDVTQPVVRELGLAAGLVDDKVCAIDATWSGLRFRRRRRP